METIKQLNKKTDITYVFESLSYLDKKTRQPRSRRKLIGRIDDATGEIVTARKKSEVTTTSSKLGDDITTYNADVSVSMDI